MNTLSPRGEVFGISRSYFKGYGIIFFCIIDRAAHLLDLAATQIQELEGLKKVHESLDRAENYLNVGKAYIENVLENENVNETYKKQVMNEYEAGMKILRRLRSALAAGQEEMNSPLSDPKNPS